MPDPTPPPQNSADNAAAFAAKQAADLTYLKAILTSYSIAYAPSITYADAMSAVILNYQNLLDAAGAPYDEYEAQEDYVPSPESPVEYYVYLMRLVATIPGS